MIKTEVVIPKTWRSEIKGVGLYLVLCVLSVVLSYQFPSSVIVGKLFSIGAIDLFFFTLGPFTIFLHLPLWWLIPLSAYFILVARIYNVRYIIDNRGVEARVGIISLNQRITRVRYEDIRSVEAQQSLLERFLDVGTLDVSTAATGSVEVNLEGIAAPHEVQDMLNRERDARQRQRLRDMSPRGTSEDELGL